MCFEPTGRNCVIDRALRLACAVALLWAAGGSGAARGEQAEVGEVQAAGEASSVWVASPWTDAEGVARTQMMHGELGVSDEDSETGEVGQLRRVGTLRGALMPAGLAAEGDRAVAVFSGGSVVAVRAEWMEAAQAWRYERGTLPSLPTTGEVTALAAESGRVWALIEGGAVAVSETAEAPSPGPASGSSQQAEQGPPRLATTSNTAVEVVDPRRRRALGLPPLREPIAPTESGAVEEEAEPADAVDRSDGGATLWVLERGAWRAVDWPQPGAGGEAVGLTARADADGVWVLASGANENGNATSWVARATAGDGAWSEPVVWDARSLEPRGVAAAGQTWVVAQEDRGISLLAWVLRPGGVAAVGSLPVGVGEGEAWAAIGGDGAAWAVVGAAERIDDSDEGATDAEAAPELRLRAGGVQLDGARIGGGAVTVVTQPILPGPAGLAIELTVLAAAIVMVLVWYWRRPVEERTPQLPDGVAIAMLSQRLTAAAIDVLPVAGLACLAWRMSPGQLYAHWPGSMATSWEWTAVLPGAAVIGGVILHTTVAELITGKSLGKHITGLRVVTLDGSTPTPRQVVVRGLLRVMELVAWLLALLLIVGPYRQRLGDLVVGTLVVVDRPDEQDEGKDDEEDPDERP
ncbi:MAG: RDD family protein [Planctomycetota bacterium]